MLSGGRLSGSGNLKHLKYQTKGDKTQRQSFLLQGERRDMLSYKSPPTLRHIPLNPFFLFSSGVPQLHNRCCSKGLGSHSSNVIENQHISMIKYQQWLSSCGQSQFLFCRDNLSFIYVISLQSCTHFYNSLKSILSIQHTCTLKQKRLDANIKGKYEITYVQLFHHFPPVYHTFAQILISLRSTTSKDFQL